MVAAPPLVDWGATVASWNENHHPDPDVPLGTGYWPRLVTGADTYSEMVVSHGRIVGYLLSIYPALSLSQAVSRVKDELPPDAKLTRSVALPAADPSCEEMLFHSDVLAAKVGMQVLAVATSGGGTLQTSAISTVHLEPAPVSGALPAC